MPDSFDGEELSSLISAAEADRFARVREQRQQTKHSDHIQSETGIRASINAPHRVQCDGKNIAITIADTPASQDQTPNTSNNYRFTIYAHDGKAAVREGKIYTDVNDVSAVLTITGLGDAGATSVSVGHKIWINIPVDASGVPGTGVVTFGTASWWPNPNVITPGTYTNLQTAHNLLLAEIVATSDTRPGVIIGTGGSAVKAIQRCRDDQILSFWATGGANGARCLVAQPWNPSV